MCFLRSIYVNKSHTAATDAASTEAAGEAHADAVAAEVVEQLRQELSIASRQASVGEVATGTLHNVGNVLNSISVSADLVATKLRESRVGNLGKALEMLREHRGDLARFLAEDPKGKMLPGYLETLAEHLVTEQAGMARELESLGRHLEHVKEIVAMQQTYAKACGAVETLQVSELVQDALRMNLGAFDRHGIVIMREFAEVEPVTVDRHKVLQILINLMRNAKYAMDEQAPAEKRLTLKIASGGNGHVLVSVSDNGIGISPENLTRIFDHGFTTKRDGHGFGLHSGAFAAKEMGGQLTAHSDGLGKGAVFCLELPVAAHQPANQHDEHHNRCSNDLVRPGA
jgi:signal transduction histidine kinase